MRKCSSKSIKNVLMFFNLIHAYEEVCRPVCHRMNISQTALDILLFLACNPEYDTAKDISRFRGLKPNMVSFNVERLVEEGLVERREIPGDRRKIRLVCTEKAMPVVKEGRSISDRFYRELTEGLGEDDIRNFERCIRTIFDNAERIRERAEKERVHKDAP